jgi:tetratricopeptide (TPR) repeat protein
VSPPGVAELSTALEENAQAPYGRVRTARAERLVELVEQTRDRPLLIRALQQLTSAYSFGNEDVRAPVPFARVLQMWDAHPGDFTPAAASTLHWQFKWIAGDLLDHPGVPLDQITDWVDQMQARYRQAGYSERPVLRCRQLIADHLGRPEEEAEAFRRWRAAPRDRMADCEACEQHRIGEWLADAGHDQEAIDAWRPVLDGELTCLTEPLRTRAAAQPVLVRLGRLDQARSFHLAGYRAARGNEVLRDVVEAHLVFAARTGNEPRALEILADHVEWLEPQGESPLSRAYWLARVVHLMRRLELLGHGDVPIAAPRSQHGISTPTRLRRQLEPELESLSARFDARNGSSSVGDRLARVVTAEPLIDQLPLGVRGVRLAPSALAGPAPATSAPVAAPIAAPIASATSPDARLDAAAPDDTGRPRSAADLMAWADTLWQTDGSETEALDVALLAAHRADGVDEELATRARWLAAHACSYLRRDGEAIALFEEVLPDLDRWGSEVARARARSIYAGCLERQGEPVAAAALVAEAARIVEGWPDQTEHAELAHWLGELLESDGRRQEAEQAYRRAARLWRGLGRSGEAVKAERARAWVHDDPDVAVECFERAQALIADLADGPAPPDWLPEQRAETDQQFARLLLQGVWYGDVTGGVAERALALAEQAVTEYAGLGELARRSWVQAALTACQAQLTLGRRADAESRARAVRLACVEHGLTDLLDAVDEVIDDCAEDEIAGTL